MLNESKFVFWVSIFLAVSVVASASDIEIDLEQGASALHIVQEFLMGFFALLFLLALFWNMRIYKLRNAELKQELAEVKEVSAQASQELLIAKRAFGEAALQQFTLWSLTDSETDVALFTLKGLSAKEIASLRNVSEKTVRNQLTSIYRKSGTTGKLSFIAWFMEGVI